MQPVVTRTRNVLNAYRKAKVKKVVVISSTCAVLLNPNWPKGKAMDEKCWTDLEFCKAIKQSYFVAKTIAEAEALEYAQGGELNIVTVCPSIISGPMPQSTMNTSSLYLLKFLRGFYSLLQTTFAPFVSTFGQQKCNHRAYQNGSESAANGIRAFVDVRDAAEAILLLYENREAEGRYICSSHEIGTQDLFE
ncbi:putative Cinnamoyl-CoA reductase [Melia azedarach]|uniref:Cinnamoyl-CoA reductase n=1 Tax=Melia azedarach TaxID=155640 RepID=A0ACC1WTP6_MELAZ|nr:putative Cinnamoyl-CoA reductase [Melia azedarach]